jgi:hypothetical protein
VVSFEAELRGNTLRTLSYAVVFSASLSIMAAAQTKDPSAAPQKRPTANAVRTIPTVKCVDHDTAAACKSFKQLVDARDRGLLAQVLGASNFRRHTAYVCFRPNDDYFSVVDLEIPEPKSYQRHLDADQEIARDADDSVPTNAAMRAIMEQSKKAAESSEFMDFSDPPAVSQYTRDKWYQDHGKDFVYSIGEVGDYRYQDGINMGPVDDWGEWTMLASSKDGKQNDPPTWFLGGYAWIERYNSQHGDEAARDDDPEHGHISVDLSSVNVHYKYKSASGEVIDYTMHIHRLTGRFVEDFRSPNVSNQTSGTCMIFK